MLGVLRGRTQTVINVYRYGSSYSHFPFLSELGIEPVNAGVYNGTWKQGSGGILTSINPSTNEPIAQVHQASPEEYKETVARMKEANKIWVTKPAPYRYLFMEFYNIKREFSN
jgi:hypothetical protein